MNPNQMRALALGAALSFGLAGHAMAQGGKCLEKAVTQSEMTRCSLEDLRTANRKMTAAYNAVMCHLEGKERKGLAASQRAWETFEKLDCAFWGGDGSISAMNENYCRVDLANQRAKELDKWPPNAPRDALVPCK